MIQIFRTTKLSFLDNIESLKQSVLLNKASIEANYLERCKKYDSKKDDQKENYERDLRLM